mmetsp:Transcript_119810/g.208653  ORF Transcript_119810/g.208653 Transcript_119810/m.208653 type:complete len:232 (+) Transcript_119810:457-1152(+)
MAIMALRFWSPASLSRSIRRSRSSCSLCSLRASSTPALLMRSMKSGSAVPIRAIISLRALSSASPARSMKRDGICRCGIAPIIFSRRQASSLSASRESGRSDARLGSGGRIPRIPGALAPAPGGSCPGIRGVPARPGNAAPPFGGTPTREGREPGGHPATGLAAGNLPKIPARLAMPGETPGENCGPLNAGAWKGAANVVGGRAPKMPARAPTFAVGPAPRPPVGGKAPGT